MQPASGARSRAGCCDAAVSCLGCARAASLRLDAWLPAQALGETAILPARSSGCQSRDFPPSSPTRPPYRTEDAQDAGAAIAAAASGPGATASASISARAS
mmetsp:Transcript_23546/g.89441  ORF Transcript_23546/g.89441 Transcript_23546/m.89441 type:complete len:101 (+) Transcript_23546:1460-1762(+)